MRRAILLGCLLLVAGLVFGGGGQESRVYDKEHPLVLFMGSPGVPYNIEGFVKAHENVVVRNLSLDVSTGGMEAINAYLQAGIKFMVKDYGGRLGLLMTPEYALNLKPYIEDDYYPSALAMCTVGDELLALPMPGQVANFIVNQDLLDKAGYTVPENWTTDDFLEMCAKVKAIGAVPFEWYCGERNADYYFMHVLAWFGAELYKDGDYFKTAVDSPEAKRAFAFIKTLYDKGYMRKDVVTRKAADYLQSVYSGEAASYASFVGFSPNQITNMVTQKKIDKEWKYRVVPFPRGPGVSKVKAFTMQHGIVVPKSAAKGGKPDSFKDEMYVALAKYVRDREVENLSKGASVPVRKSEEGIWTGETSPDYLDTAKYYGGPWDLGLFTKRYSAIRFLAVPEFQAMLNGTKTPEEAVKSYAAEITKVLSK